MKPFQKFITEMSSRRDLEKQALASVPKNQYNELEKKLANMQEQELLTIIQGEDMMNEAAIPQERLNNRIEVKSGNYVADFGINIPAKYIIGAVAFGSVGPGRTLIVDENHDFDTKLAGTPYNARIINNMTKMRNGYVENATLAKFDLIKGTMWLAEDEDDSGNIIWGRGFKFKHMTLNPDVAFEKNWIL